MTSKRFNLSIRLRALLTPGHIKHLHSGVFQRLDEGITKLRLQVGSSFDSAAKSLPKGCVAARGGKGEGFSISVFYQDCMFAG